MTRKLLAGSLAALLLLSPLPAAAEESTPHGTDHGLRWQLSDHVLTISGEGMVCCNADRHNDDDDDYPDWKAYAGEITEIVIEEGVTGAESFAFENSPALTRVTLPSTFTCLSPYALYGCSQLSAIDGLESVTEYGFQCLTGTAYIAEQPFVIHDGQLFYAECTDLNVPDGVTEIMPFAFGNLTGEAFQAKTNADQLVVTLPDSVEVIRENAFAFCTSLTGIRLPEGLREIGDHAFYNCAGLGSLTLGEHVASIGTQAFFNCRSLKVLTVSDPEAVISEDAYGDVYNWQAVIRANSRYTDEQRTRMLSQLEENPTILDAEMSQFAVHFKTTRRYSDISFHSLPYANNPAYLTVAGTVSGSLGSTAQTYADEKHLAFAPIDGSPLPGDVNLDGFVDIMDVIALNKFLLGSSILSERARLAADLVADDEIDEVDSLEILRYVVGLR